MKLTIKININKIINKLIHILILPAAILIAIILAMFTWHKYKTSDKTLTLKQIGEQLYHKFETVIEVSAFLITLLFIHLIQNVW